jgi:hypothetical protein
VQVERVERVEQMTEPETRLGALEILEQMV